MTLPHILLTCAGLAFIVVLALYLTARHKATQLTLALAETREETEKKLQTVQALLDQERIAREGEQQKIKWHYESEAQKIQKRANEGLAAAARDMESLKKQVILTIEQTQQEGEKRLRAAQALIEQERTALQAEELRIKEHYETEAKKAQMKAEEALAIAARDLEALKKYRSLQDAENETKQILAEAVREAGALRADANALLAQAKTAAQEERAEATRKANELRYQADQLLDRATRDAAKIVETAHKNAEQIAGDAYTALRDKDTLEQAAKAIRNIIDGYGDRYVVPTHSLIDELASDFGHTEAGKRLQDARDQSKRMVEEGLAAACDYAETNRKETAIRFVIDAFNGRVDALLTEFEQENVGTIEQQIRDAYSVVNLNGRAFRDARIVPAYLDARLAELKWAITAFELRKKEREEQRRIKEQIREEEKARREYERAVREAEDEEARLKKALEKARQEVEHATAQERARFESQIAQLSQQILEAEEKNRRAISMAQQTKKGNVYIISNIGSFGEEVFKIGLTRRLEPMDRIWELSDASVPFDFDVHAMIPSDDAPALEASLHSAFEDQRINKVNYRKEFFRIPLERIRSLVTARGIEASFTLLAEAHEYRETQGLEKMSPAERQQHQDERPDGPAEVD